MDIKIIVAVHKPYWMPSDRIYFPVHVGKAGKKDIGFPGDDTGDNISLKNPNYCELTGLYWAWKNTRSDYLGLAHYRRHFSIRRRGNKKDRVLTGEQLETLLKKHDILLPRKRHYYIETNWSQYIHSHPAQDLYVTREVLAEKYPSYLSAFDAAMKRRSVHLFNMFIMKREIADQYCQWLFDVLFEVERRLDISNYSKEEARVFGFIGERLMDVWIETNKLPYKDIPYIFMEKQNWIKKGGAFLYRKFRGGRR